MGEKYPGMLRKTIRRESDRTPEASLEVVSRSVRKNLGDTYLGGLKELMTT